MIIHHIHLQIQQLINHYCKGSMRAFAVKIGIAPSSLQRHMSAEDTKKLLGHVPAILKTCPEVQEVWLYTGQGNMLGLPRPSGVRSAENQSGNLVGDLLSVALGWKDIQPDEVAERSKIPRDELQEILDSNRYPDFKILEALYLTLGINPAYFFHGNEYNMFEPQTQLEYVIFFLDRLSRYLPSDSDLQEWFNCTEQEAVEYLNAYRQARSNAVSRGPKKCIEEELPAEPSLPSRWVQYFLKHARLYHMPDGGPINPPLLQMTKGANDFLQQKIDDKEALIQSQNALIQTLQTQVKDKEKIIELYEKKAPAQANFDGRASGQ